MEHRNKKCKKWFKVFDTCSPERLTKISLMANPLSTIVDNFDKNIGIKHVNRFRKKPKAVDQLKVMNEIIQNGHFTQELLPRQFFMIISGKGLYLSPKQIQLNG